MRMYKHQDSKYKCTKYKCFISKELNGKMFLLLGLGDKMVLVFINGSPSSITIENLSIQRIIVSPSFHLKARAISDNQTANKL